MIDHLYGIAVRVETVEAARSIAVGTRLFGDTDAILPEKGVPRIHLFDAFQHEADMVEALQRGIGMRAGNAVQGKVIGAAGQVEAMHAGAKL